MTVKRKGDEWEIWDDEVASFLTEYHAEAPNSREVEQTVDIVLMHMPRRFHRVAKAAYMLKRLLQTATFEALYVHPGYWALILLLFAGGGGAVSMQVANPYLVAFYLAPTPIVFGTFILFRSREQGVAEMEASCTHSIYQLFLARFLLLAAVNVFADLTLIACISLFASTVMLTKLLLLCLWPSFLLSAVSFVISAHTKSAHLTAIVMAAWTGLVVVCAQSTLLLQWMESISAGMSILTCFLWLLGLTWQRIRMKRGMIYEFIH